MKSPLVEPQRGTRTLPLAGSVLLGLAAWSLADPGVAMPLAQIRQDPIGIALVIVLLIVCLGVHEAAHAWVALKCGDTTARDLGRLTLNPIAHIDLFMTILLPAMLILLKGPVFGGAKPVPVDFHRLRRPWRDMSLVALAGPVSNFLLAILFTFLLYALLKYGFYHGASPTPLARRADRLPLVMKTAANFNILLAVFNMVPVPPLDGSRVMAWLLPASLRPSYIALERFGLLIVFALIFWVPGFSRFLFSGMDAVQRVIESIVRLGGLW
jgi:Zn-dependent protease